MIYYLIFGIIENLLLFQFKITKHKIFLISVYIVAAIFSGIRYKVGVDYDSYLRAYNDILVGFNSGYFEFGNVLIIKLIDKIGGTYQLFFLIYSIVTSMLIYKYILFFSKNYILSTIMYLFISIFYLASFNAVRQFLAIAIFFYALKYILKNEFIKYALLILIGSCFHKSIILLLPLYFILRREFNNWEYLMYGLLGILMSSLVLSSIISLYNPNYLNFENTTTSLRSVYLFIFISLFLIFSLKQDDKKVIIIKNLLFISIVLMILMILFPNYSMVMMRFNSYFLFGLLPIISYIPTSSKIKINLPIFVLTVVLVSYTYFFNTIVNTGKRYNLVPYEINLKLLKG